MRKWISNKEFLQREWSVGDVLYTLFVYFSGEVSEIKKCVVTKVVICEETTNGVTELKRVTIDFDEDGHDYRKAVDVDCSDMNESGSYNGRHFMFLAEKDAKDFVKEQKKKVSDREIKRKKKMIESKKSKIEKLRNEINSDLKLIKTLEKDLRVFGAQYMKP